MTGGGNNRLGHIAGSGANHGSHHRTERFFSAIAARLKRFALALDGMPPNATTDHLVLKLTAVTTDAAIEV